ncbi:Uncharacterised protein [Streptococcus porcinus]|nr:Uncharacterised protein [Streptococcus porcinus]
MCEEVKNGLFAIGEENPFGQFLLGNLFSIHWQNLLMEKYQ